MKKLFLLSICITFNISTWAQKATVLLNNFDADKPMYFLIAGTPAPMNKGIQVQLLAGPVGGILAPVVPTSGGDSVLPISVVDGYFDGGVGIVPGVLPGDLAQFELRAWEGTQDLWMSWILGSIQWTQTTGYWNDLAEPPSPPKGNHWRSHPPSY
jgi:hypothetical protein